MNDAMPDRTHEREAGLRLLAVHRPHEALQHFAKAIGEGSPDPVLLNGMGAAFAMAGDEERALRCYEACLAVDSGYVPAVRNVVSAVARRDGYAAVAAALHALRARGIDSVPLRVAIAQGNRDNGLHRAAIEELEAVAREKPAYPAAWASLGWFLIEAGDVERGRAVLLDGHARFPDDPGLARIVADVDPRLLNESALVHAAQLVRGDDTGPSAIEAHLVLARRAAFESRYDDAWEHFTRSNALRRMREVYDEASTLSSVAEIERVFDREFFRRPIKAELSDRPVFIFGMPRSGTSLVEQILASHPSVYAAGELALLEDIVKEEVDATGGISNAIGVRYVERLSALAPPLAARVTDKRPANFRYAGLIARFMPQAKMIHVVRDPVDTCVSCFTTTFSSDGLPWTLDVGELARYYLSYERLMAHWKTVLPATSMLEVRYEELVADPQTQIRRMLEYVGLPWDDSCMRFDVSSRVVLTASAAQVRKPIYSSSAGVAARYGSAVAELRQALGR